MNVDQLAEERPLAMHRVERLRLLAGDPHALLRDDAQARLLDHGVDRAGQIARGRIGLDDRKGALDRHWMVFSQLRDGNSGSRRLIAARARGRQARGSAMRICATCIDGRRRDMNPLNATLSRCTAWVLLLDRATYDETIFRPRLNRWPVRPTDIHEDVMTHPAKQGEKTMFRKTIIALAAIAAVGAAALVPTTASAVAQARHHGNTASRPVRRRHRPRRSHAG